MAPASRSREVTDSRCSASGKSCFGARSEAHVNDGADVKLVWTITWLNSTIGTPIQEQKLGVVHVEDDGDMPTLIPNTNAGRCGNNPSKTNCIVSVTVGATTTTIVFRTPQQRLRQGLEVAAGAPVTSRADRSRSRSADTRSPFRS